ncbi:tandem-95 repeat protein, partial [Psychrobacter sp. Ps6]|uniref:Ig-like domain-containing protein n=1 Tax=Psychrobacter sp. Ps6 TaxID=2790960 RepID=UPI001EDEE1FB
VSDLSGNTSNQATITVDYPDTAPNAENEIQTGSIGQPVVIDVLNNDTDLESNIDPTSVKLIDPNSGLAVTTLTVPGEGSWSVDPDTGVVTFTPEAGFTNDPTPVNYVVSDLSGNTSNQATITVDYLQTAPVAVNDADTGNSGETVVVDVVTNDTDAEADLDPTTVIITQSPAGGTIAADGKSVVVDGEGSWSVNATTGAITFTPEAGFTADPTPISYSVEDINGLVSNEATVTIDYPQTAPVAVNDVGVGPLNSPVTVDILNNDNDAEGDLDPTTVKLIDPDNGDEVTTLTITGEGEWVVDPTSGAVTFTPEVGFTNDPTPVDYVVSDITGQTSNPATIVVDYPPTAPRAADDNQTGITGEAVTVAVLGNDEDFDNDIDPTTVKLIDPDNGDEVTTLTVTGEGEWVVDPTSGAVTFTPEAGYTGDPTPVDYIVVDSTNLKSDPATITIDYPQTAPVANPEVERTLEDTELNGNVIDNDTDNDGDILVVQLATVDVDGSGSQVTLDLGVATTITDVNGNPIGDLTLNADGSYVFNPATDFNGSVPTVNYTVTDPNGLTDSTTLDITVTPVNDDPVAVDDAYT